MKYFRKKEVTEKKALGKSVLLEQQQSCERAIHCPLHFSPSIFISSSKFPTPHQCQHLLLVLLAWRTTSTPPSECQHQGLALWNGIFLMDFILRHRVWGEGVFIIPPLWLLWLSAEVNRNPESQKQNDMKAQIAICGHTVGSACSNCC